MTGEEERERAALRESLIESVPLPTDLVREAMFERTFAAGPEPGGAELVPPVELFDGVPELPEPPAVGPYDFGDGGTDDIRLIDDAGDAWFTNGPPLELPMSEGTEGTDSDPGLTW